MSEELQDYKFFDHNSWMVFTMACAAALLGFASYQGGNAKVSCNTDDDAADIADDKCSALSTSTFFSVVAALFAVITAILSKTTHNATKLMLAFFTFGFFCIAKALVAISDTYYACKYDDDDIIPSKDANETICNYYTASAVLFIITAALFVIGAILAFLKKPIFDLGSFFLIGWCFFFIASAVQEGGSATSYSQLADDYSDPLHTTFNRLAGGYTAACVFTSFGAAALFGSRLASALSGDEKVSMNYSWSGVIFATGMMSLSIASIYASSAANNCADDDAGSDDDYYCNGYSAGKFLFKRDIAYSNDIYLFKFYHASIHEQVLFLDVLERFLVLLVLFFKT